MKKCAYCGTMAEDSAEKCPVCQSTDFEDDIDYSNAPASESQENDEVITKHKKHIMVATIVCVAFLFVVILSVFIGNLNRKSDYYDDSYGTSKYEMDEAYEKGESFMKQGDWESAIEQFSMVDERSGNYKKAQKGIEEARGKLREKQLAKADSYMNSNDYQAALTAIDGILLNYPNDRDALARREKVLALVEKENQKIKEDALSQARERLAQKDYAAAKTILENALKQVKNDTDLENALTTVLSEYKADFIGRINSYLQAGQTTEAVGLLKTALSVFPNDNALLSISADLRVTDVLKSATAKEIEGDLPGAIAELRSVSGTLAQNSEIVEMKNRLEAKYKDEVIAQAKSLYTTEGYLAAVQKVQQGLGVLAGDSELANLKEYYLSLAPVDLLQRYDYLEEDDCYVNTGRKDNIGNEYSRSICPSSSYSKTHITFKINKEYSVLTGVVYVKYGSRSTRESQRIKIYGDDILLYTSEFLTAGVEPIPFEIQVTGVNKLKFATEDSGYGVIEVGNLMLYK